jgi:hypothetical protein
MPTLTLDWLVYSREHNAFWRPYGCGYTFDINAAGRYTKSEAEAQCNVRDRQPDGSLSEVAVVAPEAIDRLTQDRDDLVEALRTIGVVTLSDNPNGKPTILTDEQRQRIADIVRDTLHRIAGGDTGGEG